VHKLTVFLVFWSLYLVANIFVLSFIFYLCLDVAISAISSQSVNIGIVDSIAIAAAVLALKGMFTMKFEMN